MSDEPLVLVERRERVGELILNRPHRRNALTGPLVDAMKQALLQLIEDDEVSVILIRGAGGAFCSGNDLKEFGAVPPPPWLASQEERWIDFNDLMFRCPKPTVGALEKAAIGGGAALANACDFLIAGEKAFMHVGEPSVQVAKTPHVNTVWLLWRHGVSIAMQVAMTAVPLTGPELVQRGIAVASVPDGEVVEAARAYATRLSGTMPGIVADVKRSLRELTGMEDFRSAATRVLEMQKRTSSGWAGTRGFLDQ
jgi:enoyl-CoA hydratase/carnithine racemase